ncbi:MAG: DUF1269 domain-containing protein [Planctomycetota bacterium]
MDKLIVAVFDSEKQAYEGVTALKELHDEGSLALYAFAVVARDQSDTVSIVDGADDGPLGTAVGLAAGGLVGALAGPVGLAAGAAGGSLLGSLNDLREAGVDAEFVGDVATELTPGKTAIVAHIAEGWVAPLDARMDSVGGTLLRRNRAAVVDEQIDREAESLRADVDRLRDELRNTVEDSKDFVVKNLDAASAKLESVAQQATDKADALMAEANAKVQALKDQASKAAGDLKKQYQQYIGEVQADYDQRVAKLKRAGELTKEAVLS